MKLDTRPEADRLVAAALGADARGDARTSNDLLRRCLELEPKHPHAHYLLGADCAQRGENGDAILHLTAAVEGAPGLVEARLQLGLLWLVTGHGPAAAQVLAPLRALGDGDPVGRFGAALGALAAGAIEPALESLHAGLALPCANAALVADMRALLDRLQAAAASDDPGDADRRALQHGIAISAYAGRDPRIQ